MYLTRLDASGRPPHETYRDAPTPLDAARKAARAWDRDARLDPGVYRVGRDTRGQFAVFVARTPALYAPALVTVWNPNKEGKLT